MPVKKILSIKFPIPINEEQKNIIKQAFFSASQKIGEEEFNYIDQKIHFKIKATLNSGTQWIQDLGNCYEVLYDALSTRKIERIFSVNTYKLLGAAIFYFINPFDIIPDFTPGVGYKDDLLVLLTCIKAIPKNELLLIMNIDERYEIK